MSLKSLLLTTSNAPKACLIWSVAIIVALMTVIIEGFTYNLKSDGPTIVLESPATMRQVFNDKDTTKVRLNRGEEVTVLGIVVSSFGQNWLLRSVDGNQGWVDAADLTNIRQVIKDGAEKGDIVSIRPEWSGNYVYYYVYKDRNGEDCKRNTSHFIPAFDGYEDIACSNDAVNGVCTMQKLEKNSIGKSFGEVAKKFGNPILVHVTPQGIEAQYSWKAYNPATGTMLRPNISFGPDSIATGVTYCHERNRAASWLRHLPLAAEIIDMPLTTIVVRGSRYELPSDANASVAKKALMIGILILAIVIYGLWMFFTGALPVLIMGFLLQIPIVFKPINDTPLKILMLVVAVVSAYVWSIVMMAWGIFPFWSVVIFILAYYMFTLAASPLCTSPCERCPTCRHLYSLRFDHEEFDHSEIKKGSDVVRDKLLGTRQEKWKTWTKVTHTTTYTNGHTETRTSNENIKDHTRDINRYLYIDYEITYRLDYYKRIYKCEHCDYTEFTIYVDYTELDRKFVGMHEGEEYGEERVRAGNSIHY